MSEEEKEIVNETKQLLENLTGLDISERFNNKYTGFNFLINSRNVDILIKVIEKQQNRIDELEKALVDEQLKHTDEINKAIDKLKEDIKNNIKKAGSYVRDEATVEQERAIAKFEEANEILKILE